MTAARVALLGLLSVQGAPTLAGGPNTVYHGRRNELAVQAPRLEADARIDGDLGEPVWDRAALLTGFSQ